MSWSPIAGFIPQFVNESTGLPYSGGVIKAFKPGTSTNITMAIDSDGTSPQTSMLLNSNGNPTVSGNEVIPYVNQDYKLILYPTQTDADAGTNAIWSPDSIPTFLPAKGTRLVTYTTDIASDTATPNQYLSTWHDSNKTTDSGARWVFTGTTTGGLAGTGLHTDGYVYNGNGDQYSLAGSFNVDKLGSLGDGTDDSSIVQNAINFRNTNDSGSVYFSNKEYGLGSTALSLYEGLRLKGDSTANLVSGAYNGGTWLKSSTTTNILDINGDYKSGSWVAGTDSRRSLELLNFGLLATGGGTVNSAINGDFFTESQIHNVHIRRDSGTVLTYGMFLNNSHDLDFEFVFIEDAVTGIYFENNASPTEGNEFSGQTHLKNVHFRSSPSTGTMDEGMHIKCNNNLVTNLVFVRSHFRNCNNYGLYIEGTNIHKIPVTSCHFENNGGGGSAPATASDIYIHSDVTRGPSIRDSFFNSALTKYKLHCLGDNVVFEGNELIGLTTGYGVYINGDGNNVRGNTFYGHAEFHMIYIDSSATNTVIGKNSFIDTTSQGTRIVDKGSNTYYEGELWLTSKEFDIGAADVDIFPNLVNDYWIKECQIIVTGATSVAGTTAQFGYVGTAAGYREMTIAIGESAGDNRSVRLALKNKTFTDSDVTVGTDLIAITDSFYETGQKINLTTTGTLPAGLALATPYWIIAVDDDSFKLAASEADAFAGTPVDITAAAGGGTHTVEGQNDWFLDSTNDNFQFGVTGGGGTGTVKLAVRLIPFKF